MNGKPAQAWEIYIDMD